MTWRPSAAPVFAAWAMGLLACTAVGCAGGSETGNPVMDDVIEVQLRMGAYSTDPEAVGISSGTAGTVIEEAWVSFGELAFLQGSDCALLDDFPHGEATLTVADLSEPFDLTVEVADGTYCGAVVPLQFETDPSELSEGAPPELVDHSVVLKGTRQDGTPFILMHGEPDELELLPIGGNLPVGGEDRLLMFFDVAFWMHDVDLDNAEIDSDGIIRINEAMNTALLRKFEDENLECSMQMYADTNDDGAIDEDDPLVAECPPE